MTSPVIQTKKGTGAMGRHARQAHNVSHRVVQCKGTSAMRLQLTIPASLCQINYRG